MPFYLSVLLVKLAEINADASIHQWGGNPNLANPGSGLSGHKRAMTTGSSTIPVPEEVQLYMPNVYWLVQSHFPYGRKSKWVPGWYYLKSYRRSHRSP